MTKHGGRRDGAGRPSLSKLDRFLIGARAATEARTLGRQLPDPDLNYPDIATSRGALAKVPDSVRRLIRQDLVKLGKAADPQQTRKAILKRLPEEDRPHLEWLEGELDGRRVVRAVRRTLPEIFASIAADESKRRGIPITPRMVRRWLDDYRKTQKQR